MKKVLLAILFIVVLLVTVPFVAVKAQDTVDSRTVELEKRRLEEKLQRCDMHRGNYSFYKDCRKKYRQKLKEVCDDPEYYFYKKEVNDSKKPQMCIDPRTHRPIPCIPLE